jgi:two-component system sensor histidine kinase/response regulator
MSFELFEALVSLDASLAACSEPPAVLRAVTDHLPALLPCLHRAYAVIDEDTLLPVLAKGSSSTLSDLLAGSVERGLFALALRRGQPVTEELPDGGVLLIQAVATPSHIAGLLIATCAPEAMHADRLAAVALATARAGAAHETLILHARIRAQNRELEDRVAERTRDLATALDQAEAASRAKSAFLATMSHELRTPLNGIIGMAELLHGSDPDQLRRDQLGIVRACAEDLLGHIDGILDLSRIEAGRMELSPEPCDPNVVILRALRTVAPRAAGKGLSLTFIAEPSWPTRVVVDQGRMRQVLVNLLGNAVKFTERGSIAIIASAIRDGEHWILSLAVTDTGLGMTPEVQARLFTPFEQGDDSINRRFGGTGLGLSISLRLCALMGGSIAIDSSEGIGSTFTATIRAAQVPQGDPLPLPPTVGQVQLHVSGFLARSCTNALAQVGLAISQEPPWKLAILDGGTPEAAGLMTTLPADLPVLMLIPLAGAATAVTACTQRRFATLTQPADPTDLAKLALSLACASSANLPNTLASTAAHHLASLRVLAADDQAVNRLVLAGLLGRLGITPTIVDGGAEAVAAAQSGTWDVVLLDLQMPEVDGFAAAARIRAGGCRAQLVAVTAHAMAGDREDCLARGFDDYLAKPVRQAELGQLLSRLNDLASPTATPAQAEPPACHRLTELRSEIGAEVLAEVIAAMLQDAPTLISQASTAIAAGDITTAGRRAHALKGDAANLGLDALAATARELEKAGTANDMIAGQIAIAALPALWSEAAAVLRAAST